MAEDPIGTGGGDVPAMSSLFAQQLKRYIPNWQSIPDAEIPTVVQNILALPPERKNRFLADVRARVPRYRSGQYNTEQDLRQLLSIGGGTLGNVDQPLREVPFEQTVAQDMMGGRQAPWGTAGLMELPFIPTAPPSAPQPPPLSMSPLPAHDTTAVPMPSISAASEAAPPVPAFTPTPDIAAALGIGRLPWMQGGTQTNDDPLEKMLGEQRAQMSGDHAEELRRQRFEKEVQAGMAANQQRMLDEAAQRLAGGAAPQPGVVPDATRQPIVSERVDSMGIIHDSLMDEEAAANVAHPELRMNAGENVYTGEAPANRPMSPAVEARYNQILGELGVINQNISSRPVAIDKAAVAREQIADQQRMAQLYKTDPARYRLEMVPNELSGEGGSFTRRQQFYDKVLAGEFDNLPRESFAQQALTHLGGRLAENLGFLASGIPLSFGVSFQGTPQEQLLAAIQNKTLPEDAFAGKPQERTSLQDFGVGVADLAGTLPGIMKMGAGLFGKEATALPRMNNRILGPYVSQEVSSRIGRALKEGPKIIGRDVATLGAYETTMHGQPVQGAESGAAFGTASALSHVLAAALPKGMAPAAQLLVQPLLTGTTFAGGNAAINAMQGKDWKENIEQEFGKGAALGLFNAILPYAGKIGKVLPGGEARSKFKENVKSAFVNEVEKEYSPADLHDIYVRVNKGEASAEEEALVRNINVATGKDVGAALRKGVTVSSGEQYKDWTPGWLRNFLGEETQGGVTINGGVDKPAASAQPVRNAGARTDAPTPQSTQPVQRGFMLDGRLPSMETSPAGPNIGTSDRVAAPSSRDVMALMRALTTGEPFPGAEIALKKGADRGGPTKKPAENLNSEKIVAAAVRWNGKVTSGFTHPEAWDQLGYPASVAQDNPAKFAKAEGFLTDRGRFVSREEAARIADIPENQAAAEDFGNFGADLMGLNPQEPTSRSQPEVPIESGIFSRPAESHKFPAAAQPPAAAAPARLPETPAAPPVSSPPESGTVPVADSEAATGATGEATAGRDVSAPWTPSHGDKVQGLVNGQKATGKLTSITPKKGGKPSLWVSLPDGQLRPFDSREWRPSGEVPKQPAAAPIQKPTTTEPWQLTQQEYQRSKSMTVGGVPILNANAKSEHRDIVQKAVNQRKPVPESVLKDYPDMKPNPAVASMPLPAPAAPQAPSTPQSIDEYIQGIRSKITRQYAEDYRRYAESGGREPKKPKMLGESVAKRVRNSVSKLAQRKPAKSKNHERSKQASERISNLILIHPDALKHMPALRMVFGSNSHSVDEKTFEGVRIGSNPISGKPVMTFDKSQPDKTDTQTVAGLEESTDPVHRDWHARGLSFDDIIEKAKDEIRQYQQHGAEGVIQRAETGETASESERRRSEYVRTSEGAAHASAEDMAGMNPQELLRVWNKATEQEKQKFLTLDGGKVEMTPDEIAKYDRIFYAGEWFDVKPEGGADGSITLEDGTTITLDRIFDADKTLPVDGVKKDGPAKKNEPSQEEIASPTPVAKKPTPEQEFAAQHPDQAVKGKYAEKKKAAQAKQASDAERAAQIRARISQLEREAKAGGGDAKELASLKKELAKLQPKADMFVQPEPSLIPEDVQSEASNVPSEQKVDDGISRMADLVLARLNSGEAMDNPALFKLAKQAFGGTQAQNAYTPKDAYDAMELAVNMYITGHPSFAPVKRMSGDEAIEVLRKLKVLEALLPTQSMRSEESQEFQQFSTPPAISFLVNYLGAVDPMDVYLEPSAGIGGIAAFGKAAGARVIVNELSDRRLEILRRMGFDVVMNENAEQINNLIADANRPTLVCMNPPYSAAAGRITGERKTMNATLHIEQALLALQPGGRLVAIVGQGMTMTGEGDSGARLGTGKQFKKWWDKIKQQYNVRANIGISGKEYRKYGTTFPFQILVIDKTGLTTGEINTKFYGSVEEALQDLQIADIRHGRKPPVEIARTDRESEQGARNQPKGGRNAAPSASAAGQQRNAPVPVSRVEIDDARGSLGPNRDAGDIDLPQNAEPGESSPAVSTEGERRDRNQREDTGRPGGLNTGSDSRSISGAEFDLNRQMQVDPIDLQASSKTENADSIFSEYTPRRVKIPGAVKHPASLVESAAMATVNPPAPKYTPHLTKDFVESGALSDAQLEQLIYAGQSHAQMLPSGVRRGYFIGDGTGVGKGRTISGIILDNWNQGRKKAVWVTANQKLFEDAKRDVGDIFGDDGLIFQVGETKIGNDLQQKEGIASITFSTLKSERPQKGEGTAGPSRIDQLAKWIGDPEKFDGVIVFDEAHLMGNAVPMKGSRGVQKASKQALVGIELQKRFPNARIVYSSATGATEVNNLAYGERLGLWGTGAPFASKLDFIAKVTEGGLAAMETVAMDLKRMGLYQARSLSFADVTYEKLVHDLTPQQHEVYNTLADAWQIVFQNFNAALELVASTMTKSGEKKIDGRAKGAALSAFYGAQQRFFNQILVSMQAPSAIERMKVELEKGNAIVIQLVNTFEAQNERKLTMMDKDDDLEMLDLTPREGLMQLIEHSFPVNQFNEVQDADGNVHMELALDSKGNPIVNKEAVALRDRLLEELGSIRVPESPLDMIINTFGPENVAEVTGRKRRVVRITDKDGNQKTVIESRSEVKTLADVAAFQNDQKRILIYSDAGGTGQSYHASRSVINQRRRFHFVYQAGWNAARAMQGLGRTHRTNQASAPHYLLVSTNLPAQSRFISTIARRLNQLGSLTRGERAAAGNNLFSSRDNLESQQARDAWKRLAEDIARGLIPNWSIGEFESATGLKLLDSEGRVRSDMPEITQFLNRTLALRTDQQDTLFREFSERLDAEIQKSIANGTLDLGLETLRALDIKTVKESVVYTDPTSGAETKFVELDATYPTNTLQFKDVKEKLGKVDRFVKNLRSGRVYAVSSAPPTTDKSGSIVERVRLTGPGTSRYEGRNDVIPDGRGWGTPKYEDVQEKEAKQRWDSEVEKIGTTEVRRHYLVTGALLPIWDRLSGNPRIVRVVTDKGSMLGRMIPEEAVSDVVRRLGVSASAQKFDPEDVQHRLLDGDWGATARLVNGWTLSKRWMGDSFQIVIDPGRNGFTVGEREMLKGIGANSVIKNYQTVLSLPEGPAGIEVLRKLLSSKPIESMNAKKDERAAEIKHNDAMLESKRDALDSNKRPYDEAAFQRIFANTPPAFREYMRSVMDQPDSKRYGAYSLLADSVSYSRERMGDSLHEMFHRYQIRWAPSWWHEAFLTAAETPKLMDELVGKTVADRIRNKYQRSNWGFELAAEFGRQAAEKYDSAQFIAQKWGKRFSRVVPEPMRKGFVKRFVEMAMGLLRSAWNTVAMLRGGGAKLRARVYEFLAGNVDRERHEPNRNRMSLSDLDELDPEIRGSLIRTGLRLQERGLGTEALLATEILHKYGPRYVRLASDVYKAVANSTVASPVGERVRESGPSLASDREDVQTSGQDETWSWKAPKFDTAGNPRHKLIDHHLDRFEAGAQAGDRMALDRLPEWMRSMIPEIPDVSPYFNIDLFAHVLKNRHGDTIGRKEFTAALAAMYNPMAIFRNDGHEGWLFLTNVKDRNGDPIIISMETDGRIRTVFGVEEPTKPGILHLFERLVKGTDPTGKPTGKGPRVLYVNNRQALKSSRAVTRSLRIERDPSGLGKNIKNSSDVVKWEQRKNENKSATDLNSQRELPNDKAIVRYLDGHGVGDDLRADGVQEVREGLQTMLDFGTTTYDGMQKRGAEPIPQTPENAAANALLNPTNSKAWREAFEHGDTVSSLIERLVRKEIPQTFNLRGKKIDGPADFAALMMPLRSRFFESVKVAWVDSNNRIIRVDVVGVGVENMSVMSPSMVFRMQPRGVENLGIIISHNHPSGTMSPSAEDRAVTVQARDVAKNLGIRFVDHIITNGGKYFTFAGEYSDTLSGDQYKVAPWENVPTTELHRVRSADDLGTWVKALRNGDPGYGHVIYALNSGAIARVSRHSLTEMSADSFIATVIRAAQDEGALALFFDIPVDPSLARRTLNKFKSAISDAHLVIRDVADNVTSSYAENGVLEPSGTYETRNAVQGKGGRVRLYHGTPAKWSRPMLGRPGVFWLTEDQAAAQEGYGRGGDVKAFDVQLGKLADLTRDQKLYDKLRRIYNADPDIVADPERKLSKMDPEQASVVNSAAVLAELKRRGYNSVKVFEDKTAGESSYAVFDTDQLQSADVSETSRPDQTKSPEFKKWFGDSKVVDEHGKPLVVYHGTGASFDRFRRSRRGWYGTGIYFAGNPGFAEEFDAGGDAPNIMPVFLSMQRPYRYDERPYILSGEMQNSELIREVLPKDQAERIIKRLERKDSGYFGSEIKAALQAMGHDGLIVQTMDGPEYIVFDPAQVKSTTGNRGTFDPNDPNILHSLKEDEAPTAESRSKAPAASPENDPAGAELGVLGKLKDAYKRFRHALTIDPVPGLEEAGAANEAVQHASAKIAVPLMVRALMGRVFEGVGEAEQVRFIDILNKDNILGGYDEWKRRAEEARQKADDYANPQEAADEYRDQLAEISDAAADDPQLAREAQKLKELIEELENVTPRMTERAEKYAVTLGDVVQKIAEAHDLDSYDEEVRQAAEDLIIKEAAARWREYVNTLLDRLYNEAKQMDPATEREGRGRIIKARINLLTEEKADGWQKFTDDSTKPLPEVSTSNYRNPNTKKDVYMQMAFFTGTYSTDPRLVLTAVLGPRWNEVTKIRFYNALERAGVAQILEPGEPAPTSLKGKPVKRLPIKMPITDHEGITHMAERSMVVQQDLVREIRDVLNTDMPNVSNPLLRAATTLQLMQIADAVTHAKNLQTVVLRALGAGSAWKDAVRKLPILSSLDAVGRILQVAREVMRDDPAIREEIARLAQIGGIRPEYPPDGLQRITHAQQFLHKMDTATRVVMSRFFDNLVERGLVKDEESERRKFINQAGMYNRRLMGPVMRAMRDIGISPFIVAGMNFNRQGVRHLTGNPGMKAATWQAAVEMRALNMFGTFLVLAVVPALLNYLMNGNMTGREGTPIGAVDLGMPEDEKGKHKVVDLAQWTGLRRGLRLTGFDALMNGIKDGKDINAIGGEAEKQMMQNLAHPWVGPGAAYWLKTLGGFQPDIRGEFAPDYIPDGGLKQSAENMRAAIESQNPLLYALGKTLVSAGYNRDLESVKTEGGGFVKTLLKSPKGALGIKDVRGDSPAMQTMRRMLGESMPANRTPESIDRNKDVSSYISRMRDAKSESERAAVRKDMNADLQAHKITYTDIRRIVRDARRDPFQVMFARLPYSDAKAVYEQMRPEERAKVEMLMKRKRALHDAGLADPD